MKPLVSRCFQLLLQLLSTCYQLSRSNAPTGWPASLSLVKVVNLVRASRDIYRDLITAFEVEEYLDRFMNLRARNIDPLPYKQPG